MIKKRKSKIDSGLKLAIAAVGTRYQLSKALGITPAAVTQWRRIPNNRIVQVEQVTGIDRAKLRPDLYE